MKLNLFKIEEIRLNLFQSSVNAELTHSVKYEIPHGLIIFEVLHSPFLLHFLDSIKIARYFESYSSVLFKALAQVTNIFPADHFRDIDRVVIHKFTLELNLIQFLPVIFANFLSHLLKIIRAKRKSHLIHAPGHQGYCHCLIEKRLHLYMQE